MSFNWVFHIIIAASDTVWIWVCFNSFYCVPFLTCPLMCPALICSTCETMNVVLTLQGGRSTAGWKVSACSPWGGSTDTDAAVEYLFVDSVPLSGQCVEKRAFYRLISGLHASINIHLSARYLLDGETETHKPSLTPSIPLVMFHKRFEPFLSNTNQQVNVSSTSRQLVSEDVGSQRVRVQAAVRLGADGRRGAQEAPQPLLPVPDRAAGAGQGSAVLPAAVVPALHRPSRRGPETQRAAAARPAAGQVSPRPAPRTITIQLLPLISHTCSIRIQLQVFRLWSCLFIFCKRFTL